MSVDTAEAEIRYERLLMKNLEEQKLKNESDSSKVENKVLELEEDLGAVKALERVLEENHRVIRDRISKLKVALGIKT